jgi:hypothetical protein
MDNIPANITPLALLALVLVQVLQMIRAHLDARAGREAKTEDAERALIMRLLDQQAATSEGQMKAAIAQASAMERVGSTLGEIQAHMRDTNQVLAAFQHRLEAVERRLDQGPASTAGAILAAPTRVATGRARAKAG